MPRMTPGGQRSGSRYRALRAWVIEHRHACCRCGGYVDKTLSGDHPAGPTFDHIEALALGGSMYDLANAGLSHRSCNMAHGREVARLLAQRDQSRIAQGHGRRSRAVGTQGRQAHPVTPMPATLAHPSESW